MNLYLLRHGIAAERNPSRFPDDAARPLTAEGREKLTRIARAFRALELEFDLVLSSPYVRARDTAELVVRVAALDRPVELCEHLAADGDGRRLITELAARRPVPQDVLLVGHEPYLSSLASRLLTGGPGLDLVLKKGGLCKLAVAKLRAGQCAVLEALLAPRQMTLMG